MKVSFTKYISKDTVLVLDGKTKFDVLETLISKAAELSKLDRDMIMRLTWRREKMMTTGVGFGLALPHIRVNDIPNPIVLVGICKNPVEDYESQDDQPVRLIVYIVAPDQNQEAYLQLLGSVSRKLRNTALVEEVLENITRPSQILRILKRRIPDATGETKE
ncbi:MAG: PTS sugar transporter subunit IIA [Lentisphaerae bacterium]|nr:PTS sugar transporter subunit IIA [Lentisphaerota bacterium]MCP4101801.1 PTS sugar transporter subunit IIA [Lentisphaerota bacterium]